MTWDQHHISHFSLTIYQAWAHVQAFAVYAHPSILLHINGSRLFDRSDGAFASLDGHLLHHRTLLHIYHIDSNKARLDLLGT
jgi:hypothetical protein